MEGTSTEDNILSQEDIDALLEQADKIKELEESPTGDADQLHFQDDETEIAPDTPAELRPKPRDESGRSSDADVKVMLFDLYNQAFLRRDEGVKVIWNASAVFPMTSGLSIKIQEMEYVSLGVLNEDHLIVGGKEQ